HMTLVPDSARHIFSLLLHVDPADIHPFPTRRSSDLVNRTLSLISPGQQNWHRKRLKSATIWPKVLRRSGVPPKPAPSSSSCYEKDRKSTRLNSSHVKISYAVFCLKKKTNRWPQRSPT